MSKVHFHARQVDLELSGSETFVVRQLRLLASLLGEVDAGALEGADIEPERSDAAYGRHEPTNGDTPQALQSQAIPSEAVPSEAIPSEAIPSEAVRKRR